MYFLFELLTVAGSVVFVAAILFLVCAAMILAAEGVRKLAEFSAAFGRRVAVFLSTARPGWRFGVGVAAASVQRRAR
jgi:hypothetical protein